MLKHKISVLALTAALGLPVVALAQSQTQPGDANQATQQGTTGGATGTTGGAADTTGGATGTTGGTTTGGTTATGGTTTGGTTATGGATTGGTMTTTGGTSTGGTTTTGGATGGATGTGTTTDTTTTGGTTGGATVGGGTTTGAPTTTGGGTTGGATIVTTPGQTGAGATGGATVTTTPAQTMPATAEGTPVEGQIFEQNPDQFLASTLLDANVMSREGDTVGDVIDMIITDDARIEGVVVGVGGFLGLGQKRVALRLDQIEIQTEEDGDLAFVLNATREDLENAPDFRTRDQVEAEAGATTTTLPGGVADPAAPAGGAAPGAPAPAR